MNARSIDALTPRATRYIVYDSKVAGLQLRVNPDGTKVWSLRYRFNGKQPRLKLGAYPRLSLAKARAHATKELRKVDAGSDPQAERQAAKTAAQQAKANSIEALALAYIERHAKPRKRTWRDDQSKLNCDILPRWKGRAVTSITRRDCRAVVQALADRGGPIYANRVAALLSRLFRFAVDEEIIPANPAAHLPKPGVEAQARPDGEKEEKAYDADEIRAIWLATETLDAAPRAIYRFGLVSGQRPGEVSDLEWPEIEGSWWTIPGRRTKNGRTHRVYLTSLALDVLKDVPRVEDGPPKKAPTAASPKRPKPRYAFAGYRGKRQLAEVNAQVFASVRRREKPRHALRSTVATGLATCGVSTEDISKVLNHAYGPRVTAGYNEYQYDREKRLALSKWARKLSAILEQKKDDGKKWGAKVLPHQSPRRA